MIFDFFLLSCEIVLADEMGQCACNKTSDFWCVKGRLHDRPEYSVADMTNNANANLKVHKLNKFMACEGSFQ